MNARFSPPKDKADLLKALVDKNSPFNELRDVLFFAALIGWKEQRRVPLSARGEAIRWDVMVNRTGTEIVTDMIAVATYPDDRELLSEARKDERVALLEEYANGGLEVIRDRLSEAGAVPSRSVILSMVQDYLEDDSNAEQEDLATKVLNL